MEKILQQNAHHKIPKIIHFFHDYDLEIWKKDKQPQLRMCYMSWKLKCPDYEIMHWHDKMPEFQEMLEKSKFLRRCYELKIWAFVSDYVRLYALKKYGGIYLDTDVMLLNNFDNFLSNSLFISIEGNIILDETLFEPAVIGCEKNNPVINEIINYYNTDEIFSLPNKMAPHVYSKVLKKVTGFTTIKFNDGIDDTLSPLKNDEQVKILATEEQYRNTKIYYDEKNNIRIYPSEYFCPTWPHFHEKAITENTVAIHYNQSSWWGDKQSEEKLFLLNKNVNGVEDFIVLTKVVGKILTKTRFHSGKREIFLFGKKIFSYTRKGTI